MNSPGQTRIDRESFLYRQCEVFGLQLIFYARHNAHGYIHRNHRLSSVAEKRERDADNGGNADAHSDIDEGLERDRGGNTETDYHVKGAA